MNRNTLVVLIVGALLYYGYLRFRGVIAGNPLSPMVAARGNGSA